MVKVLLIQVNAPGSSGQSSRGHIGLAYLAAFAIERGHDTDVIDAKAEGIDNQEVMRRIKASHPDLLGLSARTPDIKECEKLAAETKRLYPSTKTVVGGAHVSGLGARVLEECEFLDFGVMSEGEETLSELLECFESGDTGYDKIDGLIYRAGANIETNPPRAMIENIDSLPFPAWHLFPRGTDMPLFTSRGCPYRCTFCQRVGGDKVRVMSPERVMELIEKSIREFGTTFFQIEDEVFGVSKRRYHRLLDMMIDKGIGHKVTWIANSRVNLADLEMYQKMREAGCIGLGFGIESGNQEILNTVNKGFKLSQAERAIALAKQAGLETHAFFILGHPNETKATLRDTINFACKLNVTDVAFGLMIPYPGTEIFNLARNKQAGYAGCSDDWEQYSKYSGGVLEFKNLKRSTLNRYQKQAYFEFYVRNLRFRELFQKFKDYLSMN